MKTIMTIKELREALSEYDDKDFVVIEIHEGSRTNDLYNFYVDVIDGIQLTDGNVVREIRLCI